MTKDQKFENNMAFLDILSAVLKIRIRIEYVVLKLKTDCEQ